MDTNAPTDKPVTDDKAAAPADGAAPMPAQPAVGGEKMAGMGMSGKKWMMLIVAAVVVLAGGGSALYMYLKHQSDLKKPVKIGVMLPFSGDAASSGYGELKGIQLAKKQLGANVQLFQEDSKCDGDAAKAAIKKLIADQVIAIIGEACSSASLEALPLANAAHVVMISASASSPKLTIPNDYFFRVVPPDGFQGAFAAKYIYNKGLHTVATVYSDEAYGKGLDETFVAAYKALGGTIISENPFENGALDMSAIVTKVHASKPDAIYLLGTSVVSIVSALQGLQAAGNTAPVFSGDSMYDPVVIEQAGTAVEGMSLTVFPTGTQSFAQALANAYATDEQTYAAAQGYDALQALNLAIKAGARTGIDMKDKLSKVSFDGVSGKISFDKNGEISNSQYQYQIVQVQNGKYVTLSE